MKRRSMSTGMLLMGLALHADRILAGGGVPSPKPVLSTRLFMPGHVMIRGKAGPLEGYFALDTGAPGNAPMPDFSKLLREGKPATGKVPGEILIEGKKFSLDFGTGGRVGPAVEKVYPGVPILAVLGAPLLSRYTVRFNHIEQTFSLYETGDLVLPRPDELGPEHVLVDFTQTSQGHILVDIAMGEGDPLKGKAIFDNGTPRFECRSSLGAKHGFPPGRIPVMHIGKMAWTDVPTNADREGLFNAPFFKGAGVIGFLSNEQLYNAVVTIHYKERKLEIRRDPSRALGPSPEEFGLELSLGGAVVQVKEGSRAAACGLKAGDLLRAVDGRAVCNRMEVASALRLHDGKTPLAFQVARSGVDLSLGDGSVRR